MLSENILSKLRIRLISYSENVIQQSGTINFSRLIGTTQMKFYSIYDENIVIPLLYIRVIDYNNNKHDLLCENGIIVLPNIPIISIEYSLNPFND